MIKSVIFDLDGTLLNTIDDLADAGNWVCTQNNWPTYTIEEFKQFVGRGIPYMVEQFTPQEHRQKDVVAGALAQFTARYAAHKEDKTCAYDGICEMLRSLGNMGVKCYILTNKAEALCPPLVAKYFDNMVLATLGNRPDVAPKPNPEAMATLLKEQKIEKETAIYVGDSEVDMQTAKNSDMPALAVLWGFRTKEFLAENGAKIFIENPAEIVEYVKEQNK